MARLRLFGLARVAAGTGSDWVPAGTVAEAISWAGDRYGPTFTELLATCQIWVNGEPAEGNRLLTDTDEVAVLPPVSGGCGDPDRPHRR